MPLESLSLEAIRGTFEGKSQVRLTRDLLGDAATDALVNLMEVDVLDLTLEGAREETPARPKRTPLPRPVRVRRAGV